MPAPNVREIVETTMRVRRGHGVRYPLKAVERILADVRFHLDTHPELKHPLPSPWGWRGTVVCFAMGEEHYEAVLRRQNQHYVDLVDTAMKAAELPPEEPRRI